MDLLKLHGSFTGGSREGSREVHEKVTRSSQVVHK